MKKRTITLCLVVLAFFMLIGVGFAAWVISNSQGETKTGNITVDTVTDNRVTVSYAWKDDVNTVVFGYDATYEPTNAWLTNDDTDMAAVMSVELIVTVKDDEGNYFDSYDDVEVTAEFDSDIAFGDYIVAPATLTAEADENVATNGQYHIVITFTWGDAFNNLNPYKYYNELTGGVAGFDAIGAVEGTTDNGDVAKANLEAIEAYGANATFTVTVSVKHN